MLATGGADSVAKTWDTASGERIRDFIGHGDWIIEVSFSPDLRLLATAGGDGSVIVWDATNGEQLLTITNDSSIAYWNIYFSRAGSHLLATRRNQMVEM